MCRVAQCLLLLTLISGPALADNPDSARGAELLIPYKQGLQQALLKGLAGGPVQAIDACKIAAPEIAADLSKGGVVLGRTSHKLRNPGNAPPDWVAPILRHYAAANGDLEPRTVSLPGNRAGYVEPILLKPLCLSCHGDVQDPVLAERISAAYPEDQATGFAPGDLRGVFWVEYPLAEIEQ